MSNQSYSEPACHSYLGDQLKDSRRRGIFDVEWGKEYRLLLIPLVDIVLFPGETIPLRLQDQNIVNHVKRIINDLENSSLGDQEREDLVIGVVNNPRSGRGRTSLSGCFGTTIEIRSSSCSRVNDFSSYLDSGRTFEEIVLTGRGQYRFQIVRLHHVGSGVNYATVRMFDERTANHNSERLELGTFPSWVYKSNAPSALAKKAFLMVETALFWKAESSALLGRWGLLSNLPLTEAAQSTDKERGSPLDTSSAHKTKRTRTSSEAGGVPSSSCEKISSSCRADSSTSSDLRFDHFHSALYGAELDPVGFSFFLSANLPVSNEQLQSLLAASNVTERLRLCIQYLEMGTGKVLACGVCRLALASKQQVFTVPGAEGVTGAYVNPHGAVHQTITVRDILDSRAVVLHGRPCAEDSWFPGYAWTIASCARCLNHLGWKFTQVSARGEAASNRVYALPASLASIAGTAAEALWQSFMQQQEEQRELDQEGEEVLEEEEEEDSGNSMLDSDHSSSNSSSSGLYSDSGVDEDEEESSEEDQSEERGPEEGESVDSSRSELSSAHVDLREEGAPIVRTITRVARPEATSANPTGLQLVSMGHERDGDSNAEGEDEGRGGEEEEGGSELGSSDGSDGSEAVAQADPVPTVEGIFRAPSAISTQSPRQEIHVQRVQMFWGLRRSGLVEA